MLVVRRRAGEAITIGGDVQVEVIEISRTRVKLGISAPRAVTVSRSESTAPAEDNRRAAQLLGCLTPEDLTRILNRVRGFSSVEP